MGPWRILMIFVLLLSTTRSWAQPQPPSDSSSRELVASCTYGVLAGTLVGAASLAFTDRPGDNLNRVARGASLGLYAGILLGVYAVYIVPGMGSEDEEDPVARLDRLPFLLNPTLGFRDRPDGATANWVYRF
jgi:hypothetical protein